MDHVFKRRMLLAVGSAVIGGYLVAWGWAASTANYEAVIVLLRTALVTVALTWVALVVWWWRRVKTFTVRSLVFGGPLLVGVLAVPLPYYSHGRSVQNSLQNAGVQYRVQAEGFSQTLQQVTNEVLSIDSPNLFASQLTYIGVDLAKARQDQLVKIGRHPSLLLARIVKSNIDQNFTPQFIQWIDALPQHTRVDLQLYKPDEHDLRQLELIQRTLQEVRIYSDPRATSAIERLLECQPDSFYLSSVTFPKDFWTMPTGPVKVKEVHLNHCQLMGDQLLKLAELSRCTTLNCDNLVMQLTVDQCAQLAALPHLENLLLGTTALQIDQLRPLMASAKLKSFVAALRGTAKQEELDELRASVPEGCNRRVRVDYGVGIVVGDVGLRRGM